MTTRKKRPAKPTDVLVAGKTYSILFGKVPGEDDGECDSRKQIILVDDELHLEQQQDTLLHEIYHAADHEAHTKMTEGQVRRHSTMLLAALRASPEVVAFILQKD